MASRSAHREGLLRGVTQKDMKQSLRKLFKRGWEAEVTGNTHVRLVHRESGASFIASLTSSNRDAGHILMRDADRALKKAHKQGKETLR